MKDAKPSKDHTLSFYVKDHKGMSSWFAPEELEISIEQLGYANGPYSPLYVSVPKEWQFKQLYPIYNDYLKEVPVTKPETELEKTACEAEHALALDHLGAIV